MNLDIRVASRDDLPILIELYAQMDGDSPLPIEKVEEVWNAIAQFRDYHIYLACQNEAVVGTFSLLFVPTMMHRGYHKFAVIDSVAVFPNFRGRGIGGEMVKYAMKISGDAGCYKVMLSSNLQRERAHKFYQSLGFEQHGWSFKCVLQSDVKV